MAQEIERRFLVRGESWKNDAESGTRMVQGYLTSGSGPAVRIRKTPDAAFLTIKGRRTGATAQEFEYSIPLEDADGLLELCGERVVEKVRTRVRVGAHVWEVDVFDGRNAGLAIAELELDSEGERFERPEWLGQEITGDHRYANSSLSERPFREW